MKFPRIRPYKTFLVDDDGKRRRLDAHEIVLERPIGVDLEINLAPHPRFGGRVSFSTFRGSSLVLEPESGSGLYLFIEDWPRGDRVAAGSQRAARSSSISRGGHVRVHGLVGGVGRGAGGDGAFVECAR